MPSLFFLALPLGGLPVLFIQPQQIGGVRLVDQQLTHLLLRPVVLGVCRLFLCHEPCKFFVQAPDRGQLFQAERIKGFLRRLVDEDMSLYNTGTRTGLIAALEEMRGYLAADETELRELTDSAIAKLRRMSDAEYDALDLFPDFEKEDMDAE